MATLTLPSEREHWKELEANVSHSLLAKTDKKTDSAGRIGTPEWSQLRPADSEWKASLLAACRVSSAHWVR